MELNFLEAPSEFSLDQEVAMPHRTLVCPTPSIVLEVQALLPRPGRHERTVGNMAPSSQAIQRSFSSPVNCERQASINSIFKQTSYGGKLGSILPVSPHLGP